MRGGSPPPGGAVLGASVARGPGRCHPHFSAPPLAADRACPSRAARTPAAGRTAARPWGGRRAPGRLLGQARAGAQEPVAPYFPALTSSATAWIWSAVSMPPKGSITPCPSVTALTTVVLDGLRSSRSGPPCPLRFRLPGCGSWSNRPRGRRPFRRSPSQAVGHPRSEAPRERPESRPFRRSSSTGTDSPSRSSPPPSPRRLPATAARIAPPPRPGRPRRVPCGHSMATTCRTPGG